MDELDAQLAAEISAKEQAQETQTEQGQGPEPEAKPEETQETKPEVKMFDENYVKALRQENAKYRRELRDEQARNKTVQQPQQNQHPYYNGPQQRQEIYDPRVDDLLLSNKLNEIKADPYFSELFSEVDDMGITFEEKLLERALKDGWPVSELDALVFKMEKDKLIGKVRQKAVDEAYKSMSAKANTSAERTVTAGKNASEGEVNSVEDAIQKSLKEHGITDLSQLR